jgi:hypothetical protein
MNEATREAILEPKIVGEISDNFFVPGYQRGYRWGRTEVQNLLKDIWESRDRPYYLQPIVVQELGDEFELVDGQQRLTTLFLILQYMLNEGLKKAGANYSIRYETRPGSAKYLERPDPARSQENIDFFHIYEAYQAIHDWFTKERQGDDLQTVADELRIALFRQVRVIWYLAPRGEVDATTLFTRLNVGRIALTDAELVKALLLSEIRQLPSDTDLSLETAVEWDMIERELRDPERWAFITGKSEEEPTHISLLFDTLADQVSDELRDKTGKTPEDRRPLRGRERPPFHTFETLRKQIASHPLGFWRQVVDRHSLVMGWHHNRDLYHKIGYLVAERVSTLADLVPVAAERPKSAFESELDSLIRGHLSLTENLLRELSFRSSKTSRVLLLMNVETIRQRRHSTERYSFKEHASGRWSIEHLHAQNAQQLPRSSDVWERWLRLAHRAVKGISTSGAGNHGNLLARVEKVLENLPVKGAQFDALERELTSVLSEGSGFTAVDIDSIANLALLDGGDNSALSNSGFAVKRNAILDRDREGSYVPVCTRNVFLKYYSPGAEHQADFWSIDDRKHYLNAMVELLRKERFLVSEDGAE